MTTGLHEAPSDLTEETQDIHRAVRSLMEELEAIDWYQQRVDAARDPELKAILAHNRDEEKEHAAMVLEWLRRHDAVLDESLRTYLFTQGPVTEIEESETGQSPAPSGPGPSAPARGPAESAVPSPSVGSLRGK